MHPSLSTHHPKLLEPHVISCMNQDQGVNASASRNKYAEGHQQRAGTPTLFANPPCGQELRTTPHFRKEGCLLVVDGLPHEHLAGAAAVRDGLLSEGGDSL